MSRIRIDKYLSNMGYGSRRSIKKEIKNGVVLVNGDVAKDPSSSVDTKEDTVIYRGEAVVYEEFTYIMMNKPPGVISSTDSRQTNVIDILDERLKNIRLFPVGRLDKDTEGLLILTNDGQMAHNLLSPNKKVTKKYYVEIDGELSNNQINRLENGVKLEDSYQCLPANVQIIHSDNTLCKLTITIQEGKYHQVKRMMLSVGRKVIYLKRIAMGELILDETLKLGEYRYLSKSELKKLPTSKD